MTHPVEEQANQLAILYGGQVWDALLNLNVSSSVTRAQQPNRKLD